MGLHQSGRLGGTVHAPSLRKAPESGAQKGEQEGAMAHKFNRERVDPYAEAAHAVEENLVTGTAGYEADAESQVFDSLSNVIVTALGDVAATAFRLGISDRRQMEGLASAVAHCADAVFTSYVGEVDPEPALQAVAKDPRLDSMPAEQQNRLMREIERTRQVEHLVTTARRLPDLLDLAGQIGLYVPDEVMESGEIVMTTHPTPTEPTAAQLPQDRG
jgi:hypothetical protein